MDGAQKNSSQSSEKTICDEVWKEIPGYEGVYEVSNYGRVRSNARKVWNYTKQGRILKPHRKENGYMQITLCGRSKYEKHAYIHRLVAEAFIPNPNNLPQVNHKDFDKANNCVENLEWVTAAENHLHFAQSNRLQRSKARKQRTLINKSLQFILENKDCVLREYDAGCSIVETAEKCGVGRDMARDILMIYGRL